MITKYKYIVEMKNIKHLDLYNIVDSEFIFDFQKILKGTRKKSTELNIIDRNTISFETKEECMDIFYTLAKKIKEEIKVKVIDLKANQNFNFTLNYKKEKENYGLDKLSCNTL